MRMKVDFIHIKTIYGRCDANTLNTPTLLADVMAAKNATFTERCTENSSLEAQSGDPSVLRLNSGSMVE